MEVKEIQSKSILSPCGIPGIDYVINPYLGCRFGCTYCYASFMGRFIKDKSIADWGKYVHAKINAPDLLKKEYPKKFKKDNGKSIEIFFSSVTDPYQGMEVKYELTRQCLQILADFEFDGFVSILTKSDLVLRDIDVLKKLKNTAVGLTVTSTDDKITRYFEKYAPPVSKRYRALKKLNEVGIQTYAFIGPLLPHYVAFESELEKVFINLAETGTKDLFVEHLNLSKYIKQRLIESMKESSKEIVKEFYESQSKDYRKALDQLVIKYVKKYKMNLLTGGTIFHREYQEKNNEAEFKFK